MFVLNEYGTEPETVLESHGIRVLTMDSIAFASPALAGEVIVTGSHGGASAGQYARRAGVAAVVCNDAGVGKDDAGIAGLALMDRAGLPGVAASHLSAAISDGPDLWDSGVISHVNEAARAAGFEAGTPVADAVRRFVERREV